MKIPESGTEIDVTLISEGQPTGGEVQVNRQVDLRPEWQVSGQPTLALGELVAERYRMGPVIGAGGMGIIYKAQHIELGTSVAFKVIRPDIARNSSAWRRFSREARALGALHNRHVVRVHDAGTLASGLRYLVMELLDGTDLRRVLQREGALQIPRSVDYVGQVCSALGDAHRLNIIHRDVKPENLFLARYRGGEPMIKLLDFGVALFLDDAGQLTIPGRNVGSPHYLSPEQMHNPSGVDQRSDIWAIGLLMFELLSGRSPFYGLNAAQISLKISKGPMPAVAEAVPHLPAALAVIIQRCLALDPARRPQSTDELMAALEPFSSRHAQVAVGQMPHATAGHEAPQQHAHKPAPKRGLVPRLLGWASP
jgi:eukaryotic-like serine/threonine-protein kinase